MRLWLDDLRPMPFGYDIHVKTAEETIKLLEKGDVVYISFDHDLGEEENGTGYDVAKWIEEAAFNKLIPQLKWKIHSANPVGEKNIKLAMDKADEFWVNGKEKN